MSIDEAIAWLSDERSSCNMIQNEPFETRELRTAQTDAAFMQQAYVVLKAHKEGLLSQKETTP